MGATSRSSDTNRVAATPVADCDRQVVIADDLAEVSDQWRLEQGDSLALLQGLEPGTVDMVLTDPPFSSGGAFRGDRAARTSSKYTDHGYQGAAALPDFTGDNRDQRSFMVWCGLWFGPPPFFQFGRSQFGAQTRPHTQRRSRNAY